MGLILTAEEIAKVIHVNPLLSIGTLGEYQDVAKAQASHMGREIVKHLQDTWEGFDYQYAVVRELELYLKQEGL